MGLFKRRSKKGPKQAGSVKTDSKARDTKFDAMLRKGFGLEFRGTGWHFQGVLVTEMAAALSMPKMCVEVIGSMRRQLGFDQVCVAATAPHPTLVFQRKTAHGIEHLAEG